MSVLFSFSTFFFFYQILPKCISKCLQVQAEVEIGSADISVFMPFADAISICCDIQQINSDIRQHLKSRIFTHFLFVLLPKQKIFLPISTTLVSLNNGKRYDWYTIPFTFSSIAVIFFSSSERAYDTIILKFLCPISSITVRGSTFAVTSLVENL